MKKYGTLLSLYLAQSIPMSFFSTVIPVIMRQENYSLESIGYLQLIKLPWILKFLWAPLIDRKGESRKEYRKIILISELFYALVIVSIAFFNLETDFTLIIVLMVIAFVASATQDIATDAFAILSLRKKERSFGNSMQSAGSFLGTLFGSGVLLIIYYYLGWKFLLVGLAGFVILALLPLYFSKKDEQNNKMTGNIDMGKRKTARLKDIPSFFSQKGIYRQIITFSIFYSGLIGILAMVKPYLVDLNYDAGQIGFISGIFGTSLGALSALGAGFVGKKITVRKSIITFAFINLLAAFGFFLMNHFGPTPLLIYLFIGLLWSAYGMSTVAIYTLAMNSVRPGREGTDFTIQIVLTHLSSLIMAVFSGKIADQIGYHGLFLLESLIAASVLVVVFILFQLKFTENANTRKAFV